MSFCTVINCIDGRTQLPVIEYVQNRFVVEFVDMITEAGPVGILATGPDSVYAVSIFRRVVVSLNGHSSKQIAIVAHYDCLGNPLPEGEQIKQLQKCLALLSQRFPNAEIIGLWLDQDFEVHEVSTWRATK